MEFFVIFGVTTKAFTVIVFVILKTLNLLQLVISSVLYQLLITSKVSIFLSLIGSNSFSFTLLSEVLLDSNYNIFKNINFISLIQNLQL